MRDLHPKQPLFPLLLRKKGVWLIIPLLVLVVLFFSLSPPVFNAPFSTVIRASNGSMLGAHVASDGQWRFPPSDSIPEKYKEALLCYEDRHFYRHPGINPWSLVRAARQNLKAGTIESGGSTLTMQVARMSMNLPRTYANKLYEMVKALRLEASTGKDEILRLYASHAPFGGNIVGLETAAWFYFGRPPQHLTWAESALLAILPNAPGLLHPGKNRTLLKQKRDLLLDELARREVLNPLELSLALGEPLPSQPSQLPAVAPHLLDYYLQTHPGTAIETTLNSNLQYRTTRALQQHSGQLAQNQISHAAALIVHVETGEVLAYVGNSRPHHSENGHAVDMTRARRSSGSILKPFLYAAALQDGLILPWSLLADVPTRYRNYAPQNYYRQYDGAVPAGEALSRSLNVPFVRLLHQYNGERFLDKLKNTGFTTFTRPYRHYGLSLILGGGENTLFELAGTYASMARTLNHYTRNSSSYLMNDFRPLRVIAAPPDQEAEKWAVQPPVFSAGAIWHTFEAMAGVVRPPTEAGWQHFTSSRRIAWKTGTSFGLRDAWSVGISRDYVVAVWAGNASGEGRPGLLGGTTAAPLMFELFDMLPSSPWFDKPYDDLEEAEICAASGFRAGPDCPNTGIRDIPRTLKPTQPCPYHRLIHLTPDRRFQTRRECEPSGRVVTTSWFTLPPLMEWYYRQKNPGYRQLPPLRPGCGGGDENPMDFIYPNLPVTTVMIPVDLNGEQEKLVFSAVHRDAGETLYWHLDESYLGETRNPHEMELLPPPGRHLLTIIDEDGNRVRRSIIVK